MIALLIRIFSLLALLSYSLNAFAVEGMSLKLVQPVLTDNKEGMMKSPQGIDCDDAGLFIVADSGNGRLLSYTYKNDIVAFGSEIKVPQLPYPVRVQLNSKGDIFVFDGKLRRIAHLNPQGAFQGYLDPQALPSTAPVVLRSFKIDRQDNIYLLDILTERVLVLDPTGKFQKQIPFPANYGSFSDLAVNRNGDVYLLDSTNAMVFVASKDTNAFIPLTKNLREDMNFPANISIDSGGKIFLVDQNGGGIIVLGQHGAFLARMLSMGWKPGFLYYPSQICINGKGTVFVADRDNNRVQIFELSR
jgi:DNA-binding beta-propeller fold protein YncE